MAKITINEVSQDYSYNVNSASYCTVAMPITACWGPGFEDPDSLGVDLDTALESTAFQHFSATQAGLESFVSTYRGPSTNYRSAKDNSYQMAMTLIASGYDIDVVRLAPGAHAQGSLTTTTSTETSTSALHIKAKYSGTFGNSIYATVKKVINQPYWNLIVYIIDSTGSRKAVENKVFVFNLDNSSDTIMHVTELSSDFITLSVDNINSDNIEFTSDNVTLTGGTDKAADGNKTAQQLMEDAIELAEARYDMVGESDITQYKTALENVKNSASLDASNAAKIKFNEWKYTYAMSVYTILTDKLAYNSNRVISPGWDDQDITEIDGSVPTSLRISPLHARLMDVAYNSRCATAYLDIPRSLPRSGVFNESSEYSEMGYAQKISDYTSVAGDALFASHSALFAPWGQYAYVGTSKQATASPSFLALMIHRAMILNQSLQYEWALPTVRKHKLNIGKLDYSVPKKLLDVWQTTEGTAVNVIAYIPDLGMSVWGNSTCYSVPPATYNALQNLSTRWLANAIENVAYRCGLSITFQYNNEEAYAKFYAGVSPTLDLMKNVGAIEKYKISMAADINGLDSVNANSVVGTIQIWVYGVVNDITIDLIALPVTDAE